MPVAAFDGLRRGTVDWRSDGDLRMIVWQADLDDHIRGRFKHLLRLAAVVGIQHPQMIDGKTEPLAQDRQVDLQPVVPLQCAPGPKTQTTLRATATHGLDLADEGAAMANGVAVGDFLVLVR